jgi:HAD superfamily hydrolase (TIGR01509 family)
VSFDPSKVRAILFDLDGTLADTDDEYIRRLARWTRPLHILFPRRDPAPFLRWAVMTAESPMNTLMTIPDWMGIDDKLVAVMNWFSDLWPRAHAGRFAIMPGVESLLEQLSQRYPLALVTARPARSTNDFLAQFDLGKFFRAVASAQTAPHTKPYPDPVHWCARALGVSVENCVMAGDTTVDILAGKRAGAQTIGLLCGFGQRDELERAGADLVLEHTTRLADVLLK